MKTINILYAEHKPPIRCASIEEMDRALDELHDSVQEGACIVAIAIINEADDEIIAGLGRDLSGITVQISPRDGEFYQSLGGETPGKEIMAYGYYQDVYWDSESLIPIDAVREAIRHFVRYGRRDPAVRWKDWTGDPCSD